MKRRRFAACLLLPTLAGLSGCSGGDCSVRACDATQRAQPSGGIGTGIVGVVASRSDACEDDCCPCDHGSTTLQVFEVEQPIASAEDALQRLGTQAPARTLAVDTRYGAELSPGRYAVCDRLPRTCANVVLEAGSVFTVNVQLIYGPMLMRVFDQTGARRKELVVGDGAPY